MKNILVHVHCIFTWQWAWCANWHISIGIHLYCKLKSQQHYRETSRWPPMNKLGQSGKEKLPFNKKKPLAEPGSWRGGHLYCRRYLTIQYNCWLLLLLLWFGVGWIKLNWIEIEICRNCLGWGEADTTTWTLHLNLTCNEKDNVFTINDKKL